MKLILLINIVGILTLMSRIDNMLSCIEHETYFDFDYFSIYEQFRFHAQLSQALKSFFITETSPYKSYHRFAPNIVKTGEIWGWY